MGDWWSHPFRDWTLRGFNGENECIQVFWQPPNPRSVMRIYVKQVQIQMMYDVLGSVNTLITVDLPPGFRERTPPIEFMMQIKMGSYPRTQKHLETWVEKVMNVYFPLICAYHELHDAYFATIEGGGGI